LTGTTTQQKAKEAEFRASLPHDLSPKERREKLDAWRATAKQVQTQVQAQPLQAETQVVEAQPEAAQAQAQAYMPGGPLTSVLCDLPGWERVVVWFDLSVRWEALTTPVKDDDGWGTLRRIMALCPRIEWPYTNVLTEAQYPDSVAPDLDSYKVLVSRAHDVLLWLFSDGVSKAEQAALKNS